MSHDFHPQKKFGQHFLKDLSIVDRIVEAGRISPEDHLLEVGGGPGILTQALINAHPRHLTVIELDRQFWSHLEALGFHQPFTLLTGDALRLSLDSIGAQFLKIIANLPYNIGTQLIINWLQEKSRIDVMILMLQKEVVDRICATPGQKSYGRLSILIQSQCTARALFNVPSSAFYPPPNVDSSVVEIRPLPYAYDGRFLERLTHIVFQQRRKMLRVSLRSLNIPNLESLLESLEISPLSRPEEHSVETFIKLATALEAYLPPHP